MAGSYLPSAGSVGGGGASPPPRTPPSASRKRRRGDGDGGGDDDDDGASPSPPSRATRAAVAARATAVSAVRTARRAAAGALWAGRGRVRGLGDVGRMREVLLAVRGARYASVPDDDDHPYRKVSPLARRRREFVRAEWGFWFAASVSLVRWGVIGAGLLGARRRRCRFSARVKQESWSSYLSSYPLKQVRTDPVEHQASVPEWENGPSVEYTDGYKAATLPKLGTVVYPLNMDISATNKSEKKRKNLVDRCKCSRPGSEECVQVHVKKARSWIKDQLGEEAFKNCGLDAMGDQVGEQWTAVFKRKLEKIDKMIPQNKHQKFMGIALKELGQKEKKNLAKYYYNVFLPRRMASLTRAKHKKDEAVDTSDEKSDQEDEENERRPRKKRKKSFGSSSTRSKK